MDALVAAGLPGYRVESVTVLGEGLENVAYEVNGELVVRVAKGGGAPAELEARVLAAVAEVSPLPVPAPVFASGGCLAYFKLPGRPLLELPAAARAAWAPALVAPLADLLRALHAMPAPAGVPVDADPLERWRAEAAGLVDAVPAAHRPRVDAFLAAPPPPDGDWEPVFSHNDLGIEHVLADPGTGAITGIIDWSDAAVADPAYDYGLLYRDLGPVALAETPVALRGRAVFYARCSVLEELNYGRSPYVQNALAALDRLF